MEILYVEVRDRCVYVTLHLLVQKTSGRKITLAPFFESSIKMTGFCALFVVGTIKKKIKDGVRVFVLPPQ